MSFLTVKYSNKTNNSNKSKKALSLRVIKIKGIKTVAALIACSLGLTSIAYANDYSAPNSSVSDEAFQQIMKTSFPLTPEQIHTYKTAKVNYEKAKEMPAGNAPIRAVSKLLTVDIKPGAAMTLINMSYQNITALHFSDKNGNPWPIDTVAVGDASAFHVTSRKTPGLLYVTASKRFAMSNLLITFKGLDVPMMFNLVVGGNNKTYDYLDYIKVPLAQDGTDNSGNLLTPAPNYLNGILTDMAPKGAKLLKTNSDLLKVWRYGTKYLIATRATLLSPAYKARVNSAKLSGSNTYHAYEIKSTPILILSVNGSQQTVTITDNTTDSMNSGSNSLNPNMIGGGNV